MLSNAARSLVVHAALADPSFAERPTTVALGIGAYTGVPLRTADGAVYGTLCTLHPTSRMPAEGEIALLQLAGQLVMQAVDADQQRRREQAQALALREATTLLQLREARFRALAEHGSDLVCILAADGSALYGSPSYTRVLGAPIETLHADAGAPFAVIHPDDREQVHAALAGCMRDGRHPVAITSRHRHADGSWRTLESIATNRLDDPAVGGIVVTSRDVSARAAAEAVLRASEASLRRLVEVAPIGMAVCTLDGHFEQVNAAYCATVGYAHEDLVGEAVGMVIAPESRAAISHTFARRAAEDASDASEWTAVTKGGEPRTILGSGVTLEWTDGAPRRISFTVDITERKRAERQLAELAHYDRLTGLPNRTLFADRLGEALARANKQGGQITLLFVDLDGFKAANDTYGHGTGDLLLQTAAERLLGCVRKGDTVARLAGDEFTAILDDVGTHEIAARVAGKMLASLAEPFHLGGEAVRVGGSIGVAIYPTDGEDASTLLAAADAAMYQAKRAGKQLVSFAAQE